MAAMQATMPGRAISVIARWRCRAVFCRPMDSSTWRCERLSCSSTRARCALRMSTASRWRSRISRRISSCSRWRSSAMGLVYRIADALDRALHGDRVVDALEHQVAHAPAGDSHRAVAEDAAEHALVDLDGLDGLELHLLGLAADDALFQDHALVGDAALLVLEAQEDVQRDREQDAEGGD